MRVDMTREALGRLKAEVIDLLSLIDRVADGTVIFARHPGYRKALEHLTHSTYLIDHLEAAQYFVVAFSVMFPGCGLRQDLINATSAGMIGKWTYEPYDDTGAPLGVQLEDGLECVFSHESPLAAIVRMLRLALIHGWLGDVDIDRVKRAELVGPEALPGPTPPDVVRVDMPHQDPVREALRRRKGLTDA